MKIALLHIPDVDEWDALWTSLDDAGIDYAFTDASSSPYMFVQDFPCVASLARIVGEHGGSIVHHAEREDAPCDDDPQDTHADPALNPESDA